MRGFFHEARICADLTKKDARKTAFRETKKIRVNPNVAAIFSIEEAGGVDFMTMELVDGCTLKQITTRGSVSMAQLFDIAIALADALSAAHRKHIIDRDLKPANVMMTEEGRVKDLDLG